MAGSYALWTHFTTAYRPYVERWGAKFLVDCPHCEHRTVACEADGPHRTFLPPQLTPYALTVCQVCQEVLLIAPDDPRAESDGTNPRSALVLWPTSDRVLSELIPPRLRREIQDSRASVRAGAYPSAVVMVRRVLEGVCVDQGVLRTPLYSALREMRAKGLVDGRLLAWAEGLRVLGNEGAHFSGGPIDREDAEDALHLAEALLDYLYVHAHRHAAFRERRGESPATSDGSSDDAPAVVTLRRAGVEYTEHAYPRDPARTPSRRAVADALGVPYHRMYKAVVAYVDEHVVLALVPVDQEVDLLALAAVMDSGSARIATGTEVTGFEVVSPLGLPLRVPTVLDAGALTLDTVYVSSGRRGLELEVARPDLVRLTAATTAPIARPRQ
jgi:Cys-tRNA(Pro) deacylase